MLCVVMLCVIMMNVVAPPNNSSGVECSTDCATAAGQTFLLTVGAVVDLNLRPATTNSMGITTTEFKMFAKCGKNKNKVIFCHYFVYL